MKKPSVEWVDALVAKREATGLWTQEELQFYRKELLQKYNLKG